MVSILPPSAAIALHTAHGKLDERFVARHDAVLIVCPDKDVLKHLRRLPFASLWRKLHDQNHPDGATPSFFVNAPNAASTPMMIGFVKPSASSFECLTLAGKWIKESKLCTYKNILIAQVGDLPRAAIEAVLAAALAAAASMPSLKSKKLPAPRLERIAILSKHSADYRTTVATNAGNHLARWLTSLPPNYLDSATYAQALKALARRMRWRYEFLGIRKLEALGAGAFLSVARANDRQHAGIVKLSYRPRTKARTTIALVGKGICFDTGGINLKSHKSMYQMHEDMQGSAVAVGTLLALTELDAPIAIDCWLALTENEIGPRAYRPQEVVRACNGVTIQVAHSDAEGRMVLADTLALASRDKPKAIVDFATLTGACVGALTERMSGVFTNRDEWRSSLEQAGRNSGERVWNFPMDEDFDSDLNSPIADILQCTPDSKGDHILAARFLSRFVDRDIGWVHVDLAASNRAGGLAHIPTDFTGFGVRFAVEWLLDHVKRDV